MKDLIQTLVETASPSGYEGPIRAVVRDLVAPYADEVRVDALGNLIVRKGDPEAPRLMLAAHLDEIGVVVTHVDEHGFVRFTNIGGVRPLNCIGGRVRFLNGVQGVIYMERLPDGVHTPRLEHLYIDVGATGPHDCPVRVGDVAAFERPFLDLGDRLVAKSMDDRIGVAVLVETLRRLERTAYNAFFVFSVQEEVGLRGATTAAFGIAPEIGLAVDVTGTGDTPRGMKMAVRLGQGPAVKVRDGRMLADPRVVDWMVHTAQRARLPHQMEVLEGGTTDATAIQLTQTGVPAGCLSIPCRYVHSPSEMVDYRDVQGAVALLLALLNTPIKLQ